MTDAPSTVDDTQLRDLSIRLRLPPKAEAAPSGSEPKA
jgi:hypothetical protein